MRYPHRGLLERLKKHHSRGGRKTVRDKGWGQLSRNKISMLTGEMHAGTQANCGFLDTGSMRLSRAAFQHGQGTGSQAPSWEAIGSWWLVGKGRSVFSKGVDSAPINSASVNGPALMHMQTVKIGLSEWLFSFLKRDMKLEGLRS